MIYVYALTDPVMPPREQAGLSGEPLQTTVAADACGVYSVTHDGGPQVTPEHLWHHETVVERIVALGVATLPTRFGTVLADVDQLRSMLTEHADVIGAALDRVRGLVEVGVRLRLVDQPEASSPAPRPTGQPGAGRAYLLHRVEQERRRQQREATLTDTARRVLAPLDAVADDASPPTPSRGSAVISTAYLVAPADVSSFGASVASIDAEHDDVELVATGPWPAYSFAPVLLERAAHA